MHEHMYRTEIQLAFSFLIYGNRLIIEIVLSLSLCASRIDDGRSRIGLIKEKRSIYCCRGWQQDQDKRMARLSFYRKLMMAYSTGCPAIFSLLNTREERVQQVGDVLILKTYSARIRFFLSIIDRIICCCFLYTTFLKSEQKWRRRRRKKSCIRIIKATHAHEREDDQWKKINIEMMKKSSRREKTEPTKIEISFIRRMRSIRCNAIRGTQGRWWWA